MSKFSAFLLTLLIPLVSCVSPGEISVLQSINWTVFGLVGEGKAPVIFVYSLNEEDPSYIYYEGADITVTNLDLDVSVSLIPIKNTEDISFFASNEFPFDDDTSGNVVYYTTPFNIPMPTGNYSIELKLGKESGIAFVDFPEVHSFNSVSINEGSNSSKLVMELPEISATGYHKWEILVDQVLDIQVPTVYDSISGEPVIFETVPLPFYQEITPKKYIRPDIIEEDGLIFKYNLTENLPDYPYTDESYQLNVRLRNYSADLVEFFESVSAQQSGTLFDPFVEPNLIHSNIDGLFGVIGTYSYSQNVQLHYNP